jgi:hypothetical protein
MMWYPPSIYTTPPVISFAPSSEEGCRRADIVVVIVPRLQARVCPPADDAARQSQCVHIERFREKFILRIRGQIFGPGHSRPFVPLTAIPGPPKSAEVGGWVS